MNDPSKPGPKIKDIYSCDCCETPRTFSTSKKKCDHQRNTRKKTSKTEAAYSRAGNMASLDDFEMPQQIGLPTKLSLDKLPRVSISSAFKAYFKPIVLNGQPIVGTTLGPNVIK